MESKRSPVGFDRTPLRFILLLAALTLCLGLGGCTKNCADAEKELTRYADGSKAIGDEAKVLKECREVIDKCVGQTVPYEVMGDIDAKNKKLEAAIRNYEKVLVTNSGNVRVKDKIEKIDAELKEAQEKALELVMSAIPSMTLSKYAALDPTVRLTWCERYMFKGQTHPQDYVQVHYSISPQQLDAELMHRAANEPSAPIMDYAYKYVMSHAKMSANIKLR